MTLILRLEKAECASLTGHLAYTDTGLEAEEGVSYTS